MIDLESLLLAAYTAIGGSGADWKGYTTVLVEPVEYRAEPGAKDAISESDRRRLTDYYYGRLRQELSRPYTVVTQPVADTPTIRLKATLVRENGQVRSELKAVDLATGQVLAEAAEDRKAGKALPGKLEKYEDVRAACREWARRAAEKLCASQGRTDCPPASRD